MTRQAILEKLGNAVDSAVYTSPSFGWLGKSLTAR